MFHKLTRALAGLLFRTRGDVAEGKRREVEKTQARLAKEKQ
jgi:hypothetical protein